MIDKILDGIYDLVDTSCERGEFECIDSWLAGLEIKKITIDELLGWLTATLPYKRKLKYRAILFIEVEKEVKARGEWEEDLLKGLES